MPYDPDKVRRVLESAHGHTTMPNAEYVKEVIGCLRDTEIDLKAERDVSRKLSADLTDVREEFDREKERHRKLRESSSGLPSSIDALKVIALNPKGAKAVAVNQLKALGVTVGA